MLTTSQPANLSVHIKENEEVRGEGHTCINIHKHGSPGHDWCVKTSDMIVKLGNVGWLRSFQLETHIMT